MKIYSYDKDTFELLVDGVADPDPMQTRKDEGGALIVEGWLIPAYATSIAPPAVQDHQVAVFVPSGTPAPFWDVVPDWRGHALYSKADGSAFEINEIGKSPEDVGATDVAPPDAGYKWIGSGWVADATARDVVLSQRRERVYASIKAHRDGIKNGGTQVSGKWFHTDTDSRIQYIGLNMMQAIPSGLQWKTMDGTFTPMTKELASAIFVAITQLDIDAFAAGENHKSAMLACDDPLAYDFSAGWPVVFAG